ncbi:MAG TPA: long-chain-fatty-acid--CoA ligase [Frankiaceae bacterium]|nr:long-chain-fatty-acid--CoA ligase [Frankiaceae bacterium]
MSTDSRPDIDPALLASRRYTWLTQLARHASQIPDRTAIRYLGETTTWAQLHERVERLAAALHSRGVGEGDRLALVMTNCREYVESVLAINRLGAIAVPVNFRLVADEITWILDDCGAKGLLVDAPLAPIAGKVRANDPELLCLVAGGTAAGALSDAGPGAEDYDEVLAAADAAAAPQVVVQETAICLIMYTSGTTGRPKGAMLSHLNLLMQSITIIRGWQLFADDEITLVAAPLFHIAGIGAIAPMLLIGGVTVIMPTKAFDPTETLDLLESERVTGVFLVPTQWQALCTAAAEAKTSRDLALRAISWGASPAPASTLQAMADTFPGLPNIAVFGQTEMSPVTCVLDGADALRKIGSVGKPVPTVAVRIVDEEMNDVPDGAVGEIVYRGPSLMEGYWDNPAATAEAFADGWFHSGDLVRRDDEGFIYVVDRKKDMIISGGENIYCAEVESVLASHPKVQEVSLIGTPHPRWVETPLAVITPADPNDPPTLDDLNAWCRDRLASYKKPTAIEIVEALPRNASGKVLKGDLREKYATT